jgi:hypothetical protein
VHRDRRACVTRVARHDNIDSTGTRETIQAKRGSAARFVPKSYSERPHEKRVNA